MKKSRQFQAEKEKTISVTEVKELRFKIHKPDKGLIEIVNCADYGRICTLRISDFLSVSDAQVYAELIKLAPELLRDYLTDAKTLQEVVSRLQKKVEQQKEKKNKNKIKNV